LEVAAAVRGNLSQWREQSAVSLGTGDKIDRRSIAV
jgi:hypothetical protein